MSYSRLKYDDCSYMHQLKESVTPGEYMLQTPRVDCGGACYMPAPGVNLGGTGGAICDKQLIDVDSELMGITRKATKCPTAQYLPSSKPFCEARMPRECPELTAEPTRISNGPCTLRGIPNGFNRWEWLCQDPQATALVPFDYMINNRIIVKDNHRPCLPKPLDQSAALPPAANMDVCYDWSSKWMTPENSVQPPSAQNPPSWTLSVCGRA